jgi:hypothetical protein
MLQALLIPALTGFAISKLSGASTKKALQSALLGAAAGGITSGFTASQAAANTSAINQMEAFGGAANTGALSNSPQGIASNLFSGASDLLSKGAGKVPGFGDMSYNQLAALGIGGKLLYDSYANAANAPKKSLFYGANVNYANPAIYNQVGPNKFKVGSYDAQGNYTGPVQMEGAKDYVPPEAVYAKGEVPAMPYAVSEQMIRAKEGGLATLKGIQKFYQGGQVLPSKETHDENDINNYIRANGHVVDGTGNGDKEEDTVLAQLADGEFVTRTDGVLGAGIIAGANPKNMKQMREKGAKYFYEQQARFKRVFDLLQQSKAEAA